MVYLDNAASTPLAEPALRAFMAAAREHFANPSSAHALGAAASRALESARAEIARFLRAEAGTITFTSGGTESNALGILGAAQARKHQRQIVISAIEHPSVLRNADQLEAQGWKVVIVPPETTGVIDANKLLGNVDPNTGVVSLMLANNELGTLQPVEFVARMLKQLPRAPHLHVDAVAAAPFVKIDVAVLGADSLSLSSHKLHGPKGVGALWLRKGARVLPLWQGGGQEAGLRQGTENLAGIVAFAAACADASSGFQSAVTRVTELRDAFENAACAALSAVTPTVPTGTPRTAHICSLRFARLPAEPLLHALEARGVFAAAGSACSSKGKGPSHVLTAIGLNKNEAVLRFSFSRQNTQDDIDNAVKALTLAVADLGNITDIRTARSAR
jgi:cysteine desulfurase